MKRLSFRSLLRLLAMAILFPALAAAADRKPFPEVLATPEQLQSLKEGGFTLYVRHGLTDNSRPDRVPNVDLNDCSTQRPLSPGGRMIMEEIGKRFPKAAIPVGEVYASPMCRAKDTAQAMFPDRAVAVDLNLRYVANMTAADKAPVIRRTRELLSQPPAPGTNAVIVAHGPNIMELIDYFPREGTVVICRPRGNGLFEYVASIPPAHWEALLP